MTNRMIFIFGAIIFFLAFLIVWVVNYFWKMSSRSAPDSLVTAKSPQEGGPEKRKHPRVDVNWPVSIETSYGTMAGEVKNVSLGGAFICCKKPLPLRKVFRMTMIGPDNEPLTATAQVAWSNANMPEEKVVNRGMGVRFIKMSDRHLELVRQISLRSD
ncbi:MAG: PilZ domain-containing protein [Thermodesulfobacteriota bacterium]